MDFPEERTYSSLVKTGNWVEDQYVQSYRIKDFMEKRDRGELLIQKREKIRDIFLIPSEIDFAVNDGVVHFGDKVAIKHLGFTDNEPTIPCLVGANLGDNSILNVPHELPADECVGAIPCLDTNIRTIFMIKGVNNQESSKSPLTYGECFELWTTDGAGGNLRLYSCPRTLIENSKRTTGQIVKLVAKSSQHTRWQILPIDAAQRIELKGYPVVANTIVLINHVSTNRNLSLEWKVKFPGFQNAEYEIAAKNHVDGHKRAQKENYWTLWMQVMSRENCPEQKLEVNKIQNEILTPHDENILTSDLNTRNDS